MEALQMTSLQNTPKYDGVKNNIVIWGEKSDTKLPIRYHLMIDYIPAVEAGKVYKGWIYRNLDGDKLNPQPTGAFRAISEEKYKKLKDKLRGYVQFEYTLNTETDWRLALYLHFALEDYNFTDEYAFLAKEIVEELPKIYNLLTLVEKEAVFSDSDYELQKGRGQWLCMLRQTDGEEIPDTESANWYLDILDVSQIPSLRGLAISAIGRRDKVISDKAVNCLFTPNFNDVIFLERGETAAS